MDSIRILYRQPYLVTYLIQHRGSFGESNKENRNGTGGRGLGLGQINVGLLTFADDK